MIIEIEPLDTVIFRDGKPFGMGDDSWTDSLIFPTPTTIYGALRGTYFSQNPNDFKKIKSNDVTENLIIKGIYLCRDDELFYQIPKDCIQRLGSEEITTLKLKKNSLSSNSMDYYLSLDEEIESINNKLLDEITFDDYLNEADTFYAIDLDQLVTKESKIGIGRDIDKGVAKKGLLYRMEMLRYEFKIIVEFEGLKLNDSGLMKFGGESKGANYRKLESIELPNTPTIDGSIFKLYLLTPAIFDKGWIPNWIDEKSFIGQYRGVTLKLLTCATGKSQSIGGFDMKTNKPKEMFKAVPAGSVYYFEILEGESDKVIDIFHNQSISEQRTDEGYGVVILSEVKQ